MPDGNMNATLLFILLLLLLCSNVEMTHAFQKRSLKIKITDYAVAEERFILVRSELCISPGSNIVTWDFSAFTGW